MEARECCRLDAVHGGCRVKDARRRSFLEIIRESSIRDLAAFSHRDTTCQVIQTKPNETFGHTEEINYLEDELVLLCPCFARSGGFKRQKTSLAEVSGSFPRHPLATPPAILHGTGREFFMRCKAFGRASHGGRANSASVLFVCSQLHACCVVLRARPCRD